MKYRKPPWALFRAPAFLRDGRRCERRNVYEEIHAVLARQHAKHAHQRRRPGADAVILDLEDAVSPQEKDAARILVRNALSLMGFSCQTVVRINALDSGLCQQDLEEIVPQGPTALMLPKTTSAQQIQQLDYVFATHPHADHIGGMSKVLDNFGCQTFVMPDAAAYTRTFENMLQSVEACGAPRGNFSPPARSIAMCMNLSRRRDWKNEPKTRPDAFAQNPQKLR